MNHLVLSFQGKRTSNTLIHVLAKGIQDCRCNIVNSHVSVMGDELMGMMLLSGQWDAIAKTETMLLRLEQELALKIISSRTDCNNGNANLVPYAIDGVSIDQIGIVSDMIDFVLQNNLIIQEINTSKFRAPHTGAKMVLLHMSINIPTDISIAAIRGDFIDFCDRLNIDAIMEPVK